MTFPSSPPQNYSPNWASPLFGPEESSLELDPLRLFENREDPKELSWEEDPLELSVTSFSAQRKREREESPVFNLAQEEEKKSDEALSSSELIQAEIPAGASSSSSSELKRRKIDYIDLTEELSACKHPAVLEVLPSSVSISYHLHYWARESSQEIVEAIYKNHSWLIDQDPDLLFQFGSYFYLLEEKEKALPFFNRILLLNPTHVSSLYFRCKILAFLGDLENAQRALSKIADQSRSTPTRYLAAHLSFLQKDISGSISYFRSLSTEFPLSEHIRILAKKISKAISLIPTETPAQLRTLEMYKKEIDDLLSVPQRDLTGPEIERLAEEPDLVYLFGFWMRGFNSEMIKKFSRIESVRKKIQSNPMLLVQLASYFREEKMYEESLFFISLGRKSGAALPLLSYLEAEIQILLCRFPKAKVLIQHLRATMPALINTYLEALLAYQRKGFSELIDCLKRATNELPWSFRLQNILVSAIQEIEAKPVQNRASQIQLRELKLLLDKTKQAKERERAV